MSCAEFSSDIASSDRERPRRGEADLIEAATELVRGHISPSALRRRLEVQLRRVEDRRVHLLQLVRSRPPAHRGQETLQAHGDLEAEVHYLLISARHVLIALRRHTAFAESDSRLVAEGAELDRSFGTARDLRDILEHFDEYAVGSGNLQKSGEVVRSDNRLSVTVHPAREGRAAAEVDLRFASIRVPIMAFGRRLIETTALLDTVRDSVIDRAREADLLPKA